MCCVLNNCAESMHVLGPCHDGDRLCNVATLSSEHVVLPTSKLVGSHVQTALVITRKPLRLTDVLDA